jgi:phosphoethanolamine N-methyltransferase
MKKLILSLIMTATLTCPSYSSPDYISSIDSSYNDEFLAIVEDIYGSGILSQGGYDHIDSLFASESINSSSKILDIGSGVGGPIIHLAKSHPATFVGIDPCKTAIDRANQLLAKNKDTLKGDVSFILHKDPFSLSLFQDSSFDFIFSVETILHVPLEHKLTYFKEMHRILKPGGKIIIMDWLRTDKPYSPKTKEMMEIDEVPFNMVTQDQYLKTLSDSSFSNIKFNDATEEHLTYTNQNIHRLSNTIKDHFIKKYGQQNYDECITSWSNQANAFKNREIITAVLTATKSL